MQHGLHLIRLSLLVLAGFFVSVVVVPLVIGYGSAQKTILGTVPDYFATCVPGWNVMNWYAQEELFIPVNELQQYLANGCRGIERITYPPGEYISNPAFLFIQRHLDQWYFMGYRVGEDHAIETILPTWNRTFHNRPLTRQFFVSMLALVMASVLTFGMYLLRRHP